jgi:hypothetical protein
MSTIGSRMSMDQTSHPCARTPHVEGLAKSASCVVPQPHPTAPCLLFAKTGHLTDRACCEREGDAGPRCGGEPLWSGDSCPTRRFFLFFSFFLGGGGGASPRVGRAHASAGVHNTVLLTSLARQAVLTHATLTPGGGLVSQKNTKRCVPGTKAGYGVPKCPPHSHVGRPRRALIKSIIVYSPSANSHGASRATSSTLRLRLPPLSGLGRAKFRRPPKQICARVRPGNLRGAAPGTERAPQWG